jgi:hypothetical protein
MIIINMSVWESVDALRNFAYRSTHAELIRQRRQWFEKFSGAFAALWWVPAGHIEAKKRIAHLDTHGPTQFAFTFQSVSEPDGEFQRGIDWSSFQPCPAM